MTCPAMPVIAVTTASYTTLRDTIAGDPIGPDAGINFRDKIQL